MFPAPFLALERMGSLPDIHPMRRPSGVEYSSACESITTAYFKTKIDPSALLLFDWAGLKA